MPYHYEVVCEVRCLPLLPEAEDILVPRRSRKKGGRSAWDTQNILVMLEYIGTDNRICYLIYYLIFALVAVSVSVKFYPIVPADISGQVL